MAVTGLSVIDARDGTIGGVYPDILRGIQAKGDCAFALTLVPRARMEAMFRNGQSDLLIPATRSPQRDASGVFVPLIHNRVTLISTRSERAPIATARELLAQSQLRVSLVRGYSFGPAYDELVKVLQRQGRVQFESDTTAVARRLESEPDVVTLMTPSILVGAIRADARFHALLPTLRFEPIEEFPWGDSGAYISRRALGAVDRDQLQALLEASVQSGLVWKKFLEYYGEDLRNEGIRPR